MKKFLVITFIAWMAGTSPAFAQSRPPRHSPPTTRPTHTTITTMPRVHKCMQSPNEAYCGSPQSGSGQQPTPRNYPGPTPGYESGRAERIHEAQNNPTSCEKHGECASPYGTDSGSYDGSNVPPGADERGTHIPTTEQPQTTCSNHIVVAGDTLWDLAGRMIGDSFRWRELLTTPVVTNHYQMAVGTVVRFCVTTHRSDGADSGEPPTDF